MYTTLGVVMALHNYAGVIFLIVSFLLVVLLSALWWRDIIRESSYLKMHTSKVLSGLKLGFLLFLVSECMIFFAIFWSFLHSALSPTADIGCVWHHTI